MSTEDPFLRSEGADPRPLADLIRRIAQRPGFSRRLEGARIHERWAQIAGDELARHTEPVRLVGGVLVVRAESSAWATQVRYLGAELAGRANDVLGPDQVTKVTIVAGALQGPGQAPREGR